MIFARKQNWNACRSLLDPAQIARVALVLILLSTSLCFSISLCEKAFAQKASAQKASAQESPTSVTVLPVLVVPKGLRAPKKQDAQLLARHLQWAQKRYREMLGNQSTFKLERKVKTFQSKWTLAEFEQANAADLVVEEFFEELGTNRFSCKYIFVAVFVIPEKKYPKGAGGRPFNGGINTGGGIVAVSYHALQSKNFQSTLQHELGHAFGLVHVNMYGYDMKRNDSIMSYNPSHHTNKLRPSGTPGILIPEDIRGFALNDRVFDDLDYDEKRQAPDGYELKPIRHLGPQDLPNHPMIEVETSSGEAYKSSVKNIVHLRIKPSIDRGEIEFDHKSMWHSDRQDDGVASVRLKFPKAVELDRINVYSQHSGKAHEATNVKVSTIGDGEELTEIGMSDIEFPDGEITFNKTAAQLWKLDFKAGKSGTVVIRGLRFFNGEQEFYPPLVPYHGER